MTTQDSLSHDAPVQAAPTGFRTRLLARHRWLPYVLPLAVYMFVGWLIADRATQPGAGSSPPVGGDAASIVLRDEAAEPPAAWVRLGYPAAYTLQIIATLGAVWFVTPAYRTVPWRVTRLAVVVGVVSGVAWIVICRLGLEVQLLTALGRADWAAYAARPAYDPLTALGESPAGLVTFLALRFLGLVVIVPLIEEFFLRGFLMRFFVQADWWEIPLGKVTWTMAVVATLYGVLSHPAEWIAAAVWFSLITLLYARTRNLWDCVVAHAITNGLLGIYVLSWRDWTLW